MFNLPDTEREPPAADPAAILAFVADNIGHAGMPTLLKVEDRLHTRLRILRERQLPADEIREALALCAARRTELAAYGGEAQPALHGNATTGT
jgi:hypothetical protein